MNTQAPLPDLAQIAHPFMVMLVDDQPFVAEMLRRQITTEKDINFHYCQDPSQAVVTAEKIVSPPADTVARFGGEEFIVLLPDTDSAGALIVAEKLRAAIENLRLPNPDSTVAPYITISLGIVTTIPMSISDPGECIKLADEALYRAKDAGRNRISIAPIPPAQTALETAR